MQQKITVRSGEELIRTGPVDVTVMLMIVMIVMIVMMVMMIMKTVHICFSSKDKKTMQYKVLDF